MQQNATLYYSIYLTNKVFNYLFSEKDLTIDWVDQESFFSRLFIAALIGPILETLIFQTAIIETIYYFSKNEKNRILLSCILSTSLFGIEHIYSLAYFVYGLLVGLYLSICYIYSKKKGENPTLTVFLIHSSWNALATFHNQ
jgi:hypothetical protein